MKFHAKAIALMLHLTVLSVLAYKYGANISAHPIAIVFTMFSTLVIVRVLFARTVQ